MKNTITIIIADGLDACVDGRGFSRKHLAAVKMANAAPTLLKECEIMLSRIEALLECPGAVETLEAYDMFGVRYGVYLRGDVSRLKRVIKKAKL